jgi:quinol-cytochrome oxidoreductase complex cytochrome b subunit/cytochrome c
MASPSEHRSEQPSGSGFWEQRTGWRPLKQLLFLEPLPGGARWSAAFGSLLLFAFTLQVVTGILLATSYAPSVDTAYPSVQFIQEEVPLGALVRAVHHWGSSAMVVLLLFHLVQVFLWGAYKKPRELTWMVGVLLLFVTLGLAFTGYLLPWDEKAYWATKVGLGIASTVPGVGDGLRTLLQGGPQMGNLTLTRFFTLHAFLLPGLLILLIVVHLYLFRLHGVTPPWWESPARLRAQEEPFWPKQALKDGVLALVFLVGLGLWCSYHPAPLGLQADPAKPYEARPEWYFMFLFQLLRYFQGPYEIVGTFILPTAFFLVLFFWPFLDRVLDGIQSRIVGLAPSHNPLRRPLAIGLLAAGTAGLVGLTAFAISTDVRMPPQLGEPEPVRAAEPAGPIQRADVARVYNDNCAACHGVDGAGSLLRAAQPTMPDFTSLAWQVANTDLDIVHQIRDGKEPTMPAYRDKLGERQILGLAVYVRAFAIGPVELPSPVPAPPGSEPQPQPAPPLAHMPPAELYRSYCVGCHDPVGRGTFGRNAGQAKIPDFTDPKWQDAAKDAELAQAILEGKPPFMAPMKKLLSPAEAEEMVALLRRARGAKGPLVEPRPKPPPEVPPAEPKIVPAPEGTPAPPPAPDTETRERLRVAGDLYGTYCLSCHGTDGRGTPMRATMSKIPDFTSRTWQAGVSNAQLAVSIREGKDQMPSFSTYVNEAHARDLAAYVRAFGPERPPPDEVPGADSDFERRYRELIREWEELQKQLRELDKSRKP